MKTTRIGLLIGTVLLGVALAQGLVIWRLREEVKDLSADQSALLRSLRELQHAREKRDSTQLPETRLEMEPTASSGPQSPTIADVRSVVAEALTAAELGTESRLTELAMRIADERERTRSAEVVEAYSSSIARKHGLTAQDQASVATIINAELQGRREAGLAGSGGKVCLFAGDPAWDVYLNLRKQRSQALNYLLGEEVAGFVSQDIDQIKL